MTISYIYFTSLICAGEVEAQRSTNDNQNVLPSSSFSNSPALLTAYDLHRPHPHPQSVLQDKPIDDTHRGEAFREHAPQLIPGQLPVLVQRTFCEADIVKFTQESFLLGKPRENGEEVGPES